jgi:hypothetical protein
VAKQDCGDPGGGSQPRRLVIDVDGVCYRIKIPDDPGGAKHNGKPSKECFNELLACELAEIVGIRTPPAALVRVEIGVIVGVIPADYFGSQFSHSYTPLPSGLKATQLSDDDKHALYLILAFDELLKGPDRKSADVLREPTGSLLAIDHGDAFTGSHWYDEHLARNQVGNSDRKPNWLFHSFDDEELAREAAGKIAGASGKFGSAVSRITEYCPLDCGDERAVRAFLEARAQNLTTLVASAIEAVQRSRQS